MKYELKSLTPFTWCPRIKGAPVLVEKCAECEDFMKTIKLRDASDNIPLPSYQVRCLFPGEREIYALDGGEVVSCAKLKYNPYVDMKKCEMCNFFVKRGARKSADGTEWPVVLCKVPTLRTVAYRWEDFKTIEGGDEKL